MADNFSTSVQIPVAAPAWIQATVVNTIQINLDWEAAAGVDFYRLYRNGALIAEPIVNFYGDIGLIPGTAYQYSVSAVDYLGNESGQSVSISATTQSTRGVFLSPAAPIIDSGSVVINDQEAFTNSTKVILKLFAEDSFQMTISNQENFSGGVWEPYQETKEWILESGDGEKTVYAKFRSKEGGTSKVATDRIILDTIPPSNVSNLWGIAGDQETLLGWQNPLEEDFKKVEIRRSVSFYPATPWEGMKIYDGAKNSFVDPGLQNDVRYFYTVFTYDWAGNYSSGAILDLVPRSDLTPFPPTPSAPPIPPSSPFPLPPSPLPLPSEMTKLTLKDFEFWQKGEKLSLKEGGVLEVENNVPLTVLIRYDYLPEVLKTILMTIENEEGSFSFLLRVNPERTYFSATILIPDKSGLYPFTLTVVDYQNQVLKKITGQIKVLPVNSNSRANFFWYLGFEDGLFLFSLNIYNQNIYFEAGPIILTTIIVSFLLCWFFLKKKRQRRET